MITITPPSPLLSFQVEFDFTAGVLTVHILKCDDLPVMDLGGLSDPYVKLYLLPERKRKYETKVHRKTLNPVFNETFKFEVKSPDHSNGANKSHLNLKFLGSRKFKYLSNET